MGKHDQEVPTVKYHQTKEGKDINSRWWLLDDKEIAANLFPLVRDIEKRQLYRRAANLRHARLYSNLEVLGFYQGLSSPSQSDLGGTGRLSLNVIKACVDTVGSKIAKAKPRPLFLTEGGNWSQQNRAKKLTKYIDGTFDAMSYYEHKQKAFRDSGIFGTGAVKFYKADGRVKCERSLIDELIVDDAESVYGSPQTLHQVRYVNRDVLLEQFPKHEEAILNAAPGFSANINSPAALNILRVVESWHIPSGKSAGDGRQAIVIDGETLHSDSWKYDHFPFEFLRWSDRITGFYGIGIAEELTGLQMEITKILRTIQKAQHLMCVPRVWLEVNSAVNKDGITNEIGGTGTYSGTAPIFTTAPAMPAEVYTHLENLYRKAFEIVGVSQLSANAKKPAGLDSGIALREFQDIESERFQLVGQRYEQGSLTAADIVIEKTEELSGSKSDLSVQVKAGRGTETIKWSDVKMDRDSYVMRTFPTSMLPTTPAGKLQTIQELTQAGFIDKEQAVDLLDFPDLESFMGLKNAPVEMIKKVIEGILENGEYQTPEPYMNLEVAKPMMQLSYLKAKMDGVPEDRLDLFRRFIDDCHAIEAQANAGAQPNPAAGGAPQAQPEAPPTSDLMPNAPGAAPGVVQ